MAKEQSSYRQLEKFLTTILFVDLACFIAYLFMAGFALTLMKIVCAVVTILTACLCLWLLFTTKELLKQRSLWLTSAFGSVILCTVVSLICNFPAP